MSFKHKKQGKAYLRCFVERLLPPGQFRSSYSEMSEGNEQIDQEEEDDEKENKCFMNLEKYLNFK